MDPQVHTDGSDDLVTVAAAHTRGYDALTSLNHAFFTTDNELSLSTVVERQVPNSSQSRESHPVTSNKAVPTLVAPDSTLRVGTDTPVAFKYPEKPVGLPAALLPSDVPALMEIYIGDEAGVDHSRYTIVHKMGYGSYSSVSLARDKHPSMSRSLRDKLRSLLRLSSRKSHASSVLLEDSRPVQQERC
ncbi:hypothetical protein BKA93DRAFT_927370, partial [Sparassis latifolia]